MLFEVEDAVEIELRLVVALVEWSEERESRKADKQ